MFVFLASMLVTYYLYSHFVVGYLVSRVVKFWAAAIIPSAVLGAVVCKIKTSKPLMRTLLHIASLIMLVDMFYWQGALPAAILIDVIAFAVLLISTRHLT
ncbi:MAG: hypothetical protein EOM12_06060 [Verrucomicrobiae bacterium]|nr:hypothetical protein [Verrucomicrobiae bacterium]